LEGEVREYVAHDAGAFAPGDLVAAGRKPRCALQRLARLEIVRPLRRRHFGHAAEQAAWWPRSHQNVAVAAARHERGAAAERAFAFRRAARQCFGVAARMRGAAFVPWAQAAGWAFGRAD